MADKPKPRLLIRKEFTAKDYVGGKEYLKPKTESKFSSMFTGSTGNILGIPPAYQTAIKDEIEKQSRFGQITQAVDTNELPYTPLKLIDDEVISSPEKTSSALGLIDTAGKEITKQKLGRFSSMVNEGVRREAPGLLNLGEVQRQNVPVEEKFGYNDINEKIKGFKVPVVTGKTKEEQAYEDKNAFMQAFDWLKGDNPIDPNLSPVSRGIIEKARLIKEFTGVPWLFKMIESAQTSQHPEWLNREKFDKLPTPSAKINYLGEILKEKRKPEEGTWEQTYKAPLTVLKSFIKGSTNTLKGIETGTVLTGAKMLGTLDPNLIKELPFTWWANKIDALTESIIPEDLTKRKGMITDIAGAVGSTIPFMLGHQVMAKMKGINPTIGTMMMGAMMNGQPAFEETLKESGDINKAFISFWLNAGLGTTEALPISRMFERLNKATGNGFAKTILSRAIKNIGRKQVLPEMGEEGLQEFGQGMGGMLIDKYITGTKKDKELSEIFAEALYQGTIGSISGGIFSGTMATGQEILNNRTESVQKKGQDELTKTLEYNKLRGVQQQAANNERILTEEDLSRNEEAYTREIAAITDVLEKADKIQEPKKKSNAIVRNLAALTEDKAGIEDLLGESGDKVTGNKVTKEEIKSGEQPETTLSDEQITRMKDAGFTDEVIAGTGPKFVDGLIAGKEKKKGLEGQTDVKRDDTKGELDLPNGKTGEDAPPVETTAKKRERLLQERKARGEVFELNEIPETSPKFTDNIANTAMPLAPSIPLDAIDFGKSFTDDSDKQNYKEAKLIEVRGRNNDGLLVGTVRLKDINGMMENYEVKFKEPEQNITKDNTNIPKAEEKANTKQETKETGISKGISKELDRLYKEQIDYKDAEIKTLTKKEKKAREEGKTEIANIYKNQIKFYEDIDLEDFKNHFYSNPDYYTTSNVDPFLRYDNRKTNLATPTELKQKGPDNGKEEKGQRDEVLTSTEQADTTEGGKAITPPEVAEKPDFTKPNPMGEGEIPFYVINKEPNFTGYDVVKSQIELLKDKNKSHYRISLLKNKQGDYAYGIEKGVDERGNFSRVDTRFENVKGDEYDKLPKTLAKIGAKLVEEAKKAPEDAGVTIKWKISPEFAKTITEAQKEKAEQKNIDRAIEYAKKDIADYNKLRDTPDIDIEALDKVIKEREDLITELEGKKKQASEPKTSGEKPNIAENLQKEGLDGEKKGAKVEKTTEEKKKIEDIADRIVEHSKPKKTDISFKEQKVNLLEQFEKIIDVIAETKLGKKGMEQARQNVKNNDFAELEKLVPGSNSSDFKDKYGQASLRKQQNYYNEIIDKLKEAGFKFTNDGIGKSIEIDILGDGKVTFHPMNTIGVYEQIKKKYPTSNTVPAQGSITKKAPDRKQSPYEVAKSYKDFQKSEDELEVAKENLKEAETNGNEQLVELMKKNLQEAEAIHTAAKNFDYAKRDKEELERRKSQREQEAIDTEYKTYVAGRSGSIYGSAQQYLRAKAMNLIKEKQAFTEKEMDLADYIMKYYDGDMDKFRADVKEKHPDYFTKAGLPSAKLYQNKAPYLAQLYRILLWQSYKPGSNRKFETTEHKSVVQAVQRIIELSSGIKKNAEENNNLIVLTGKETIADLKQLLIDKGAFWSESQPISDFYLRNDKKADLLKKVKIYNEGIKQGDIGLISTDNNKATSKVYNEIKGYGRGVIEELGLPLDDYDFTQKHKDVIEKANEKWMQFGKSKDGFINSDEVPEAKTALRKIYEELKKEIEAIDKPAEPVKVKAEEKPIEDKEKLEDFGEKIGGARKDEVKKYFDKINLNGKILSVIFPKPDIKALLDSGLSVKDVAGIKVAHEFARVDKKKGERVIKFYAAYAKNILAESINLEYKNEGYTFTDYGKSQIELRTKAYRAVHKELGADFLALDLTKVRIKEPDKDGNTTYFENGKPVEDVNYIVSYYVSRIKYHTNLEDAINDFVEQVRANTKTDAVEYKHKLSVYQDRRNSKDGYYIAFAPKGKELIKLREGLKTTKEAFEILKDAEALAEMHLQLERILAENKEQTKKTVTRLKYANETARERTGKDWRNGKDIGSKELAETFGFRAIEFGNWVNQKERQVFINNSYDSLMDLAQLLNISPKAISLAGNLGITFGSRGSGNASAHFEPERRIINLTKTKGLGSLAHEWWHAVDNYFTDFKTTGKGMQAASNLEFKTGVREEIKTAFNKLYNAVNTGDMKKRSNNLDSSRNKNYFSLPHEMSARAFENYILKRLNESGQVNDFIVNYISNDDWNGETDKYPFPTGEEAVKINDAFQELIDTFETEEQDGKTPIFARMMTSDERDTAYEIYNEKYTDALFNFAAELNKGKKKQSWNLINAARLKKIWNDYAKTGFVRDERGIDDIAEQMLTNVVKLDVNTKMAGHDTGHGADYLRDYDIPITKNIQDWFDGTGKYKNDEFIDDETGQWRLSDYGLGKLLNGAFELAVARTAEDKLLIIDGMLNVVHQRSDLASLFVEGGSTTLSELFLNKNTSFARVETLPVNEVPELLKRLVKRLLKAFPGMTEKDVVVEEHEEFLDNLLTGEGYDSRLRDKGNKVQPVAYVGSDGRIHLDGSKITGEFPIHEFGHIWARWARINAPELLNQGFKLVEMDTDLMDEAKRLYPDVSRERLYEEALMMAIGRKGEGMYENILNESKKRNLIEKFKRWMKMLFDRIFGVEKTFDEWVDARVKDLFYGKYEGMSSSGTGRSSKSVGQSIAAVKKEVKPVFYSGLEKVAMEKLPNKIAPEQVKSTLLNAGVKQAEYDWMGLDEWLKNSEFRVQNSELKDKNETRIDTNSTKIDKQELMDFIASNKVEMREVELGNYGKGEWTEKQKSRYNQLAEGYHIGELTQREIEEMQVLGRIRARDNTKFSQYKTEGGENYREVLLTIPEEKMPIDKWKYFETKGYTQAEFNQLPSSKRTDLWNEWKEKFDEERGKLKGTFTSSHFDERNIALHLRLQDFDNNGKKVLLIDEVQSDWAQKGRKEGYKSNKIQLPEGYTVTKIGEGYYFKDKNDKDIINVYDALGFVDAKRRAIEQLNNNATKVPDMPFKKNWQEVGMKWALRYAAENGYDGIAWTTGEQQAERYDLSKQVDEVEVRKPDNNFGEYSINVKKDGNLVVGKFLKENELEGFIGKDLAKKIVDDFKNEKYNYPAHKSNIYKGLDLKVGDSGMKGFYDKILPDFMNKYAKKWGGKVKSLELGVNKLELNKTYKKGEKDTQSFHSLDITPSMRASVMFEGQPMFLKSGNKVTGDKVTQSKGENALLTKEEADGLDLAKRMEQAGRDGKEIAERTGWKKGLYSSEWRMQSSELKDKSDSPQSTQRAQSEENFNDIRFARIKTENEGDWFEDENTREELDKIGRMILERFPDITDEKFMEKMNLVLSRVELRVTEEQSGVILRGVQSKSSSSSTGSSSKSEEQEQSSSKEQEKSDPRQENAGMTPSSGMTENNEGKDEKKKDDGKGEHNLVTRLKENTVNPFKGENMKGFGDFMENVQWYEKQTTKEWEAEAEGMITKLGGDDAAYDALMEGRGWNYIWNGQEGHKIQGLSNPGRVVMIQILTERYQNTVNLDKTHYSDIIGGNVPMEVQKAFQRSLNLIQLDMREGTDPARQLKARGRLNNYSRTGVVMLAEGMIKEGNRKVQKKTDKDVEISVEKLNQVKKEAIKNIEKKFQKKFEEMQKKIDELEAQKKKDEPTPTQITQKFDEGLKGATEEFKQELEKFKQNLTAKDKEIKKLLDEIEALTKQLQEGGKTKEEIEGIVKDIQEKTKKTKRKRKPIPAGKEMTEEEQRADRILKAAELLGKKIAQTFIVKEEDTQKKLIREMVKVMFGVGVEKKMIDVQKKTKEPMIEQLARQIKSKGEYTDTWKDSKEIVKETLGELFEDDNKRFDAAIKRLEDYFLHNLKDPFMEKQVQRAVRDQLKTDKVKIRDVAVMHWLDRRQAGRTLADKLINDAGLTKEEGEGLAEAVIKAMEDLTAEYNAKALINAISRGNRTGKKQKALWKQIIEASNQGYLTNEKAFEILKRKYDWKELTAENALELYRYADEIQKMPSGSIQQMMKVTDMMNYVKRSMGFDKQEFAWGWFYANLLSGPWTHIKNVKYNAINTSLEFFVRNPKEYPAAMEYGMKALFGEGSTDFAFTMAEGQKFSSKYDEQGFGMQGIAERYKTAVELLQKSKPKPGTAEYAKLTALMYIRTITRALQAEDRIFFSVNKEIEAAGLARQEAERLTDIMIRDMEAEDKKKIERTGGMKQWRQQMIRAKVMELMRNTEQDVKKAKIQAEGEGLKAGTLLYDMRVYQIIDTSRPSGIFEQSHRHGAWVTLNREPTGLMGTIARAFTFIQGQPGGMYSKLWVPFVRVSANVTSNFIDWTPYGYKRARFGETGEGRPDPRNANKEYIRATVGTLLMGAFALMGNAFVWDDDEQSKKKLRCTALGTGNYQKNAQLKETGWKEFSIYVPWLGGWYSYLDTPLQYPLTFIGYVSDIYHYQKDKMDDKDWMETTGYVLMGLFKSSLNQSLLRGLKDFFEAFGENSTGKPEEYVANFILNSALGFGVPNFFKQVLKTVDNKTYNVNGMVEKGLRNIGIAGWFGVRPGINRLGEEVRNDRTPIKSDAETNEVWNWMIDRHLYLSNPKEETEFYDSKMWNPQTGTNGMKRTFTPEEHYKFIKDTGGMIKETIIKSRFELDKMVNTDKRKNLFKEIESTANKLVKEEMSFGQQTPNTEELRYRLKNFDKWVKMKVEIDRIDQAAVKYQLLTPKGIQWRYRITDTPQDSEEQKEDLTMVVDSERVRRLVKKPTKGSKLSGDVDGFLKETGY